jgi:hypothetical protein
MNYPVYLMCTVAVIIIVIIQLPFDSQLLLSCINSGKPTATLSLIPFINLKKKQQLIPFYS